MTGFLKKQNGYAIDGGETATFWTFPLAVVKVQPRSMSWAHQIVAKPLVHVPGIALPKTRWKLVVSKFGQSPPVKHLNKQIAPQHHGALQ